MPSPVSLANLTPASGDPIYPDTPIQFDLTCTDGFATIWILIVLDPYLLPEPVLDTGELTPLYESGGSAITTITNGFRFTLRRHGGWTTQPILKLTAVSTAGVVLTI